MKKLIAMLTFAAMLLTGCGANAVPDNQTQEDYVFTDSLNREVRVNNPEKVAVLLGSFAEVWTLAGGEVFAVSEDAYAERPINLAEDTINLGSRTAPNIELMIEQGVDFAVLTANSKEQIELSDQLTRVGINHAFFDVDFFEDYLNMLDICTNITGRKDLYQENGLSIQDRIDTAIANGFTQENAPSVLLLRAFSTGVKAQNSGSMTGKILKDLGCKNIADQEGGVLDNLSMENIIKEDPDFIFVITMGSSTEKALQALKENLTQNPAWETLSAVKNDRYIILPRELFHYKPNAKWGESYEMLGEILHGEN